MKKVTLSCVVAYMSILSSSFCYAADYWYFVDGDVCVIHGVDYKYQKYEYGITYPW